MSVDVIERIASAQELLQLPEDALRHLARRQLAAACVRRHSHQPLLAEQLLAALVASLMPSV